MKTCPTCYAEVADDVGTCPLCSTQIPAGAEDDPYVGKVIRNNFLLKEYLGGGAMGSVYLAEQLSLHKQVCIKLLHEHLLGDASLAKRFQREARAASRLNHPNCIQVIDFGQTDDGLLFMAMEFIDGIDLGDLLYKSFPLPTSRVIHIATQLASALDEAHAMGIIHRDLKPENVMVEDRRTEKDFVKVLDFGIAKITDRDMSDADSFQTMTGVVCGTPEYMSPEQARGEKLDARSDLYAMGVLLYQVLTNELPFNGDTAVEIVTKHLKDAPIPPSLLRPEIPRELEELTLQLMSKNRDDRPPSALTVRDELEKIGQIIGDGANGGVVVGDRTVPGLDVGGAFDYGSGDRTLVSMPPDFAAFAAAAAEAREKAEREAAASTPETSSLSGPAAPAAPSSMDETVRGRAALLSDAPLSGVGQSDPTEPGRGQDFMETVKAPERGRVPGLGIALLVTLAVAIVAFLVYLFVFAEGPSAPPAEGMGELGAGEAIAEASGGETFGVRAPY